MNGVDVLQEMWMTLWLSRPTRLCFYSLCTNPTTRGTGTSPMTSSADPERTLAMPTHPTKRCAVKHTRTHLSLDPVWSARWDGLCAFGTISLVPLRQASSIERS
jgi:hypothetical protein